MVVSINEDVLDRFTKDSVGGDQRGSLRTPFLKRRLGNLTCFYILYLNVSIYVQVRLQIKLITHICSKISRLYLEKRCYGEKFLFFGICAFTHFIKPLPCTQVHVESTVYQVRVLNFCPGGEDLLRLDRGVWCFTFYSFKPIPVCGAGW